MIGFFDSGFGGLTILREVVKILPNYSYMYLGDNARTPYGSRSNDVIYQYTCEGIEELFQRGATIVILACNTSSAVALRKIQQEYLSLHHPDKKVLGIIIPTAEEMSEFHDIGIFATEATVRAGTYAAEISKYNPTANIFQQACPLLVPIIESGEFDQLDQGVQKYISQLFMQHKSIDAVILGCTHYAIIEDIFCRHMPKNVKVISQGKIVAEKLRDYLQRHEEIKNKLEKSKKRVFLTTENSPHIKHLAKMFYGDDIIPKFISLQK